MNSISPVPTEAGIPLRRARVVLSCDNCRNRKLRCSKEDICSNCIAKGIACTHSDAERSRAHPYCRPRKAIAEVRRRKSEVSGSVSPSLSARSSISSAGSPLPLYGGSPEPPAYHLSTSEKGFHRRSSSAMPSLDDPMIARLGINSYEALMTAFGNNGGPNFGPPVQMPAIVPSMPSMPSSPYLKRNTPSIPVAQPDMSVDELLASLLGQVPQSQPQQPPQPFWPVSAPASEQLPLFAAPVPSFDDSFPQVPMAGKETYAWTPDTDFLLDLTA